MTIQKDINKKIHHKVIRPGPVNRITIQIELDQPMLTIIPYTKEIDHSHIHLNKEQAEHLRDWLNAYLEM